MYLEGMLCTSFQLWLFPPATEAKLSVLFHMDGTFICEDDVMELLVVVHTLKTELQSFGAVRLAYQLAVFRASLDPPELLPQPLHLAFREVDARLFLELFAKLGCCEFVVLLHFSINKVQYFWRDIFIWTTWLRGIHKQLPFLETS